MFLSSLWRTAQRFLPTNAYMTVPQRAFTRVKTPLRFVVRAPSSIGRRLPRRPFSSSARRQTSDQGAPKKPLYKRLATAWKETPTKWSPLPFGIGALLLVGLQARKEWQKAEQDKAAQVQVDEHGREVLKLKGPWQVHVLGALPLRNLSRLWGYVNSLELPIWFRPFGFRLYARVFGCNLDEMENEDLTSYTCLGDFFYRRLKDGVRPVSAATLVSPADGTILHFGAIRDFRVEQVKGLTYSLDALLGADLPPTPPGTPTTEPYSVPFESRGEMAVVADREFANVNGIEYSLDQLLGDVGTTAPAAQRDPHERGTPVKDVSVDDGGAHAAHDAGVAADMGVRPALERRRSWEGARGIKDGHSLFFCVVYLAPGDYHHFHSPTSWVVERRRHFVGELYSVSPYIARRLENLFVLNERVALLGRWRYGFFGMVPVGATNVGSIIVNFDKELRTNVRGHRPPPGTYTEAVYASASSVLGGQPLAKAEEMGGFKLGSTVVLVFEAPKDFTFSCEAGKKVKMGETLGDVPAASA